MDTPHTCSLSLFKSVFTVDSKPWVFAALRHEPFIWLCLQDIEYASKALELLGNDPASWSPASLALLSLGLPARSDIYGHTPLSILDKDLRKRVSKNYEELTQGQRSYDRDPIEIEAQPHWFSQVAVPQAGLTALALCERLRLMGSWEGLQDELEGLPDFSVYAWFAPMAILYGLIPDPLTLLFELTNSESSYDMNILAMHSLLSNPVPLPERWKILLQILDSAQPHTQLRLLNFLTQKQPELSMELAKWLAALPIRNAGSLLENPGMDMLSDLVILVHQAELFRSAGQHGQSLRLFDTALKVSRNLQSDFTSRWYATADQASCSDENGFLLDHLNSQPSSEPYHQYTALESNYENLSPVDITRIKVQINSGNKATIDYWLSRINEIDPALIPDKSSIPDEIKFSLIHHLIKSGETQAARKIADELRSRYISDGLDTQAEPWLVNLYGIDSITRLEALDHLVDIELVLGSKRDLVNLEHEILKERPNDIRLLDLLGQTYRQLEHLEEALHVYELITLLEPENLDIRRAYAQCLENNKNFEAGFVEWSQILEKDIDQELAGPAVLKDMLSLSSSAILAAHPEIAINLCQKILENDVSNWQAHTLLGKANTALEKTEEGLASLQIATQLAPDQPEPWLELSRIYQALGQPQQALNVLQAAIQAVPASDEIHLELGKAYLMDNALTSAVSHLRKVYDSSLDKKSALDSALPTISLKSAEYLGQALRRLGHIDESCEVLETTVREIIDRPTAEHESLLYSYAQSLLASNEIGDAIPILERVLSFEPNSVQPYLEYGRALLSVGENAPAAVDALTYVYKANPNNPEALALLADALSANNQHSLAMEAYLEVMETDITHEGKWQERINLGLGRSALALEQVDTAIAALQEAANINPRNPVIQRWLADACWSANLPLDAWTAARKALQMDGANPELLAWFADHTLALFPSKVRGQIPAVGFSSNPEEINLDYLPASIKPDEILGETLQAYQQAYPVIKETPSILVRLGHLQAAAGKNNSAIETLRNVIDHGKSTRNDLRETAEIFFSLNDYQDTIRSLENARNFPVDDPEDSDDMQKDLICAYIAGRDFDSAEQNLEIAIRRSPLDIPLYQTLALMQFFKEDYPLSLQTLTVAFAKCNRDSYLVELHYLMAWILHDQQNFELAFVHALTSLNLIEKFETRRTGSLDVFDVLSLNVRLARSVLKPEKVKAYLSALPEYFDLALINPFNVENALDCYTNAAELDLDSQDVKCAGIALGNALNILSPEISHIHADHVRTLAIQTRIHLLKEDEKSAFENYEIGLQAFEVLTRESQPFKTNPAIYPTWKYPISKTLKANPARVEYWDFLAMIDSSLILHKFEYALGLSQKMISRWENIPITNLAYVKVITMAAEYGNLCTDLEITQNSPEITTLIPDSYAEFSKAIQATVKSIQVSGYDLNRNQESYSPQYTSNLNLMRWQCRGHAALQVEPDFLDSNGWNKFTLDAKDTAAKLALFRRWLSQSNPADQNKTIRTEINLAEVYNQDPDVQIQMALVLEKVNPEEALLICHNLTQGSKDLTPNSLQAINFALLAQVSYRHGELSTAYRAIKTALSLWGNEPYWHLLAGKILLEKPDSVQEDQNQVVLDHLERVINIDPNITQSYELIWKVLGGNNGVQSIINQRGIAILEKAASINPDHVNILLTLAKAYNVSGKVADQKLALQSAKHLISLTTSSKKQVNEAKLLLAEIALQRKDAQEALNLAASVRSEEPENDLAILIYVQALESSGQPPQALAELEKLRHIVASSRKLGLKYAELQGKCQSKELELSSLESLAKQHPDDLDVLWALARALTDIGKTDQAVQAAQSAIQKAPPDGELRYLSGLHLLLGNLLAQLGQLDQSIHHLSKSVEYTPDNSEPYLILGDVYHKQRLHLKARKAYQQAIRVSPRDPRPYLMVALSLKEGKDYQNAEIMLRKAVELSPHDVSIRKQLAAIVAINLVNNPNPSHTQNIPH